MSIASDYWNRNKKRPKSNTYIVVEKYEDDDYETPFPIKKGH
jgi:hypothetical protein